MTYDLANRDLIYSGISGKGDTTAKSFTAYSEGDSQHVNGRNPKELGRYRSRF